MRLPGWIERKSLFRTRRQRILAWCVSGMLVSGMLVALAQDRLVEQEQPQVKSKFTMARIRFTTPNFTWMRFGGYDPPWHHDNPKSEEHLMKIMAEVTRLDVNPEGHITSFEDEDCFKYPVAYLCEVGYLSLSDKEAHNMSEYLLRGGFLIVDDFRGERELDNFKQQLKRVFPDRSLEEIPRGDPIFSCFYDISQLFPPIPSIYPQSYVPSYLGMRDDKGRLMMAVDYNNDISEYWEWSDNPFAPIEDTNEAFKYGVNYLMYAMTH